MALGHDHAGADAPDPEVAAPDRCIRCKALRICHMVVSLPWGRGAALLWLSDDQYSVTLSTRASFSLNRLRLFPGDVALGKTAVAQRVKPLAGMAASSLLFAPSAKLKNTK
jgi:hypothetical protein